MEGDLGYRELKPIEKLSHLIHSFWCRENLSGSSEPVTIVPDSYAKIIFLVSEGKVTRYFKTGIWIRENNFAIPPKTISYGCRLKILAPEFLIQQEFASIIQGYQQLDIDYLNLKHFDLSSFEKIVEQWQIELLKIKSTKEIPGNKLRLAQIVETDTGDLTMKEISKQIYWSTSQINRYLNKQLGLSLKKYLTIKKVYRSYLQIREGNLFPKEGFFDQAHFIRQIKKHTGETPSTLHKEVNKRFIQIKHIKKDKH